MVQFTKWECLQWVLLSAATCQRKFLAARLSRRERGIRLICQSGGIPSLLLISNWKTSVGRKNRDKGQAREGKEGEWLPSPGTRLQTALYTKNRLGLKQRSLKQLSPGVVSLWTCAAGRPSEEPFAFVLTSPVCLPAPSPGDLNFLEMLCAHIFSDK